MKPLRIFAFADEASPQIDGQIAALRRNGLQGLEIRNVDGQNVSDISLEKAREVHKKLTDAGSPIGKIDIQKDNFEQHLQKYLHTLEIARALGAEKLRMFSFYLPKGQDPAPFRQQVIDRLSRMAELAQGSGVALCHENEKGIYGDVASRCLEILQAVPQLQGVFDPANFVQCGQETWAAWEMLRERITYMHIKDALPDGRVVPAGAGVGNVARILSAFRAQGGDAVTLEPHLQVFSGLAGLERAGDTSDVGSYCYESNDAAFDAACAALKGIL